MRRFGIRWGGLAVLGLALAGIAGDAQARSERLRWTHPEPTAVAGFRLFWGTASGDYRWTLDVGIPEQDETGAFVYYLEVADGAPVHVAVAAYRSEITSPYSNERLRMPQGSARIAGVRLVDPLSGGLIDAQLGSGDRIDTQQYQCAQVEALGYTNVGSMLFAFDEAPASCSNGNGASLYRWEGGAATGGPACVPALSASGLHALTITPYDGSDCAGPAGVASSYQIEVVGAPDAPGQPGQPRLVLP